MKIKYLKKLLILLFFFFLTMFLYSLFNIITWSKDSKETNKQIEEIKEIIEIEDVIDNEKIEIIEPIEPLPEFNPYWDYINMNLIHIDFEELKIINSDVAGWIQVNGTNINYPFVQTSNNDYYLTHSFNKNYNSAGWVFLDYRNNKGELDKNTIIYAHARIDKTMFGSLKDTLSENWKNNTDNHVIKMSTMSENTLWQVFSIYHIPTTNDYIQIDFRDNSEFLNFANMLTERSIHNFNTTVNETDKILTLSTCYSDQEKLVLHAKLIKIEKR